MPAKTSDYWREVVFELFENHPALPAAGIARKVEERSHTAPEEESTRYPAERTIRGSLRDEYRKLAEGHKAKYRYVRWPETFESGLLPWEASRPVLDLLAHLVRRPTIRHAAWFWRITLAAPEADFTWRDAAARTLHAWELLGEQAPLEDLESWLVFAPWRSEEALKRYEAAIDAGKVERTVVGPDGLRGWDAHSGPFALGAAGADEQEAIRVLVPGLSDWAIQSVSEVLHGKHRGAADDDEN